jgi:hypothetical protein
MQMHCWSCFAGRWRLESRFRTTQNTKLELKFFSLDGARDAVWYGKRPQHHHQCHTCTFFFGARVNDVITALDYNDHIFLHHNLLTVYLGQNVCAATSCLLIHEHMPKKDPACSILLHTVHCFPGPALGVDLTTMRLWLSNTSPKKVKMLIGLYNAFVYHQKQCTIYC